MLIPLSVDRPLHRPTIINHWLMGLNVGVYLVEMTLRSLAPDAYLQLMNFMRMQPTNLEPWTLITYQFAHADFLHLLFNMLFLFIFGPAIEDKLGRVRYLIFYLLGGVAAGGLHAIFFPNPLIGASGAIAGVTGAFLVLFPFTHVRVLLFFILIGTFSIPSWWLIAFAIARDIFMQGLGGGNVAHLAHLGGYNWGIGVAMLMLATGKLEREPYDLFSVSRQRWRRRRFQEATRESGSPWASETPKRMERKPKRPTQKELEHEKLLQERRAGIQSRVKDGDLEGAAAMYLESGALTSELRLHRDTQLAIANELFRIERYSESAAAYESFIRRFPSDSESPGANLMLGLILTRYLDRPADARASLEKARNSLKDSAQKDMAEALLDELGAPQE